MAEAFASPEYILSVGTGFIPARALLSAVELDVFSLLARGPADLAALEAGLGLHPRASRDFLDALVALGLLEREDGLYRNTEPAARYLDRASEDCIVAMLEMADQRLYGYWRHLTAALRSGEPQNELRSGGATLFDALAADPPRHRQFLSAMSALSRGANRAIARKFPWAGYRSFVDVGTAQGDLAAQVALAHPHLVGTGFDLPPVAPIFTDYMARHGLGGRVDFTVGDFFRDPLPQADVLMFGHILHDWNLEEKRHLIRQAWDALPAGGAILIYEAMIDDGREHNVHGLLMSLAMLIETRGGFDYSAADCMGWLAEAGFRALRREKLTGAESMVVGIR